MAKAGHQKTQSVAIISDDDPNEIEPRMSDHELQELVDDILQDEDGNDDGYIDYVEFLRSQGREITHGSADMDPKPDLVASGPSGPYY